MNILQVIPVFNPPELYGGSQQVVYQISKELVKRGHTVTVYTSDIKRSNLRERVNESIERIDGVNVVHFKSVSLRLSEKIGLIVTPTMKTVLNQRSKDFDLIHVHEVRGYQHIIVWQCARKLGLPYIVQAHGILGEHGGLARKFYDFVYCERILSDAKLNIAVNDYEVAQYEQMGVQKDKIHIVPNGIDLSEYCNLPARGCFRKKFGIAESEKIVLYLGRIHKVKGLDVLVRAFANVAAKSDSVKLVIVGSDDGYLSELVALIRTLRIENRIIFAGPLHGLAKLEAYVDADVYVLPSRYEAFPITVLEAYACGKPVIASACDGLKELVLNQETGILVRPGSASEMSEALFCLLSGKANAIGSKGKSFVRQFDIQKTVGELEKLYLRVAFAK